MQNSGVNNIEILIHVTHVMPYIIKFDYIMFCGANSRFCGASTETHVDQYLPSLLDLLTETLDMKPRGRIISTSLMS